MINRTLWFTCPNCNKDFDFIKGLCDIFDLETGEAEFDPEHGVWFTTLICNCGAEWTLNISKMQINEKRVSK